MPPSWPTGTTTELDITKQSKSLPANGRKLAKNLWPQLVLTRGDMTINTNARFQKTMRRECAENGVSGLVASAFGGKVRW